MQEISNSLRQRLDARPQPQTHPDPDTLSAYVEQVLSPVERVRIIEHLADCRDCREVVALSLPQLDPQQPVLQVAPRSRWWAPAYRWGTLAATIAVATTLIVERPWQKQSSATPAQEQAADSGKTESANASVNQAASSPAVTAPATRSAASTTAPKTPAPPVTADDKALEATNRAELRGRNPSENSPLPRPAKPAIVGGVVGGVPGGTGREAARRAALPLTGNQLSAPPPPPKVTDGEFGNRDAANVNGAAPKETVEVTAAADYVLPVAPAPQPADKQGAVRKIVPPPLGPDNMRNAMAPEIVQPSVSSSQPPPSAAENSLTRMRNFGDKKGKSKLKTAESKVVEAAKTVMEAANPVKPPSGASQGFTGAAMTAAHREDADTRSEFRRELPQKLHWSITPDGKLINSTDFSKWHEVNTQNPEIQFRVVVTEGRQVWAGGSNATLIHSWDGGVKWDTMKVPDAGDITQITIDDGWQVKTSNGQTFVSTDHGQTWVPLEQPK